MGWYELLKRYFPYILCFMYDMQIPERLWDNPITSHILCCLHGLLCPLTTDKLYYLKELLNAKSYVAAIRYVKRLDEPLQRFTQ